MGMKKEWIRSEEEKQIKRTQLAKNRHIKQTNEVKPFHFEENPNIDFHSFRSQPYLDLLNELYIFLFYHQPIEYV